MCYFLEILFFTFFSLALQAKSVIKVAWKDMPRTVDPRFSLDADSQYLEDLLHCSLVNFDEFGQIKPGLASEWKWETSTKLLLTLRDDVFFADGTKVTAQDVKANFDFYLSPDGKESARSFAYRSITNIEIKGNQLTVNLKNPDSSFLTNLSVGILPATHAKNKGMLLAGSGVLGCGPYVLKKQGLMDIVLERNSYHKSNSKNDEIEIKIVKDESTRFAKLLKGEIDLVQNGINLEKIPQITAGKYKIKLEKHSGLKLVYVGFNFQDPILSKLNVRKAIDMAINREQIIKYLLKDLASPAVTLLPKTDPYYNPNLTSKTFDPSKAQELLEKEGFKKDSSGIRFMLSYKTTQDSTRVAIAAAILSDLAKIGIKVKIESLEWGRFKSDVEKGHVQLWGLNWIGFKDPDIYEFAFATESFPPAGANRGRFSNPQIDQLLKQGRNEVRIPERIAIYQQVQELINEQLPYVFMFHESNVAFMRENVFDFKVYADGRYSSLINTYKTNI